MENHRAKKMSEIQDMPPGDMLEKLASTLLASCCSRTQEIVTLIWQTLPYLGERDPYLEHVRSIFGGIEFRANPHTLHWPMRSRKFHFVIEISWQKLDFGTCLSGKRSKKCTFRKESHCENLSLLQTGSCSCSVWFFWDIILLNSWTFNVDYCCWRKARESNIKRPEIMSCWRPLVTNVRA